MTSLTSFPLILAYEPSTSMMYFPLSFPEHECILNYISHQKTLHYSAGSRHNEPTSNALFWSPLGGSFTLRKSPSLYTQALVIAVVAVVKVLVVVIAGVTVVFFSVVVVSVVRVRVI